MMRWRIIAGMGLLMLCMALKGRAQDPQYTQFYAAHMYLNPALTGYTFDGKLSTNYRIQWPGVYAPGYNSYFIAYDQDIARLNSGIGFMVNRDRAGSGNLTHTSYSGLYSYLLPLSEKHFFRFGVQAGYVNASIDYSLLVFGDQLLREGTPSTIETFSGDRIGYLDMGTGALFYSERYWVGMSVHHINNPQISWRNVESRLPLKYSGHAGLNFPLSKGKDKEVIEKIQFAANYRAQALYDQLDFGMYYFKKPIVVGLWYRGLPIAKAYRPGYANNDAMAMLLGFQTGKLRIGYSYDLSISRITPRSGGAHELALSIEINTHQSKAKPKWASAIPCPEF